MITIEDIKTMIKEETEKLNAIGLHPVQIKEVLIVKESPFTLMLGEILVELECLITILRLQLMRLEQPLCTSCVIWFLSQDMVTELSGKPLQQK